MTTCHAETQFGVDHMSQVHSSALHCTDLLHFVSEWFSSSADLSLVLADNLPTQASHATRKKTNRAMMLTQDVCMLAC